MMRAREGDAFDEEVKFLVSAWWILGRPVEPLPSRLILMMSAREKASADLESTPPTLRLTPTPAFRAGLTSGWGEGGDYNFLDSSSLIHPSAGPPLSRP